MTEIVIRDYEPARDADALLALNNRFVDEIGLGDAAEMMALAEIALAVRVIDGEDGLAAALVLVPSGRAYGSANYQWFTARSDEPFAYIDRVMVAPEAQGAGHGRRLYEDAGLLAAEAGFPRLTCEVNERPANPGSLAFHERLGFQSLDAFENPQSGKRVRMFERRL